MSLLFSFRRLLGFGPAAPSAQGLTACGLATQHHPSNPGLPQPVVHSEEVFDADDRLCGYRFSPVRLPALPQTVIPLPGAANHAKRRLIFVAVTVAEIASDTHLALATPNTVFVLDRNDIGLQQAAGRDLLPAIRNAGCRVAISGITAAPDNLPLRDAVDMAVIEFAPAPALELQIRPLRIRYPALRFVVDGVNTWPERQQCRSLGIEYCLGTFITTLDESVTTEQVRQNQAVLVELINLLNRNAEIAELSAKARQDPSVALRLISLANAPAFGLATPVASLEQAILFMGRSQLQRLLSVTMFRAGQSQKKDAALLEIALCRACFLENLTAGTLSRPSRDELFMLGLFSVFDALLGLPMPAVLTRMPLPARMSDALLTRKGLYGRHLSLAIALHARDSAQVAAIASEMNIPLASVNATRHAAMTWAAGVLQSSQEVTGG